MKRPVPAGVVLDAAARDRLDAFVSLLTQWNARINLVAEREPALIRARHVADSLQLLPLLPHGTGPLGDLGSGGGFPGLVLAAALPAPRQVHLVEADRRKAAFLVDAAARLRLAHVQVHADRIEQVRLPPLAVLTARALAPLRDLLPHAARLLAPHGIALFPKGRSAEREIEDASAGWTYRLERFTSRSDPDATILLLGEICRAGPSA